MAFCIANVHPSVDTWVTCTSGLVLNVQLSPPLGSVIQEGEPWLSAHHCTFRLPTHINAEWVLSKHWLQNRTDGCEYSSGTHPHPQKWSSMPGKCSATMPCPQPGKWPGSSTQVFFFFFNSFLYVVYFYFMSIGIFATCMSV